MPQQPPYVAREAVFPVANGKGKATVAQWTLSQHRELAPLLAKAFGAILDGQGAQSFTALYLRVEPELEPLAQASTALDGCAWEDLMLEDLATIIQAVWEVNIATSPKGGAIARMRDAAIAIAARMLLSQLPKSETGPNSPASPSSPDAATEAPNTSAAH